MSFRTRRALTYAIAFALIGLLYQMIATSELPLVAASVWIISGTFMGTVAYVLDPTEERVRHFWHTLSGGTTSS